MKYLRLIFAILLVATPAAAQNKRPLAVDDIFNIRDVGDPQRSPDGKWVAFTAVVTV